MTKDEIAEYNKWVSAPRQTHSEVVEIVASLYKEADALYLDGAEAYLDGDREHAGESYKASQAKLALADELETMYNLEGVRR